MGVFVKDFWKMESSSDGQSRIVRGAGRGPVFSRGA
jgi:hypothetical protein